MLKLWHYAPDIRDFEWTVVNSACSAHLRAPFPTNKLKQKPIIHKIILRGTKSYWSPITNSNYNIQYSHANTYAAFSLAKFKQ